MRFEAVRYKGYEIMSNYFRMIKSPSSDKPIKYKVDRDYLSKSKAEYEEKLKKYNAENNRKKD